jgi:hypothetical protein
VPLTRADKEVIMSQKTDWFSGMRDEQLSMGRIWITILQALTGAGIKMSVVWNISDATVQELIALVNVAEAALIEAKNEATRTSVATAHCRAAFDAMEAKMRDIKKRYFYMPPLQPEDFVALGLKIPDSTLTAAGTPVAQVTAETYLIGRHELGIRIVYVTGDPNDRANKGYRLWYTMLAPGEAPPTNPEQLTKSFFTKRKKDVIEFDYNDSGNTVYFAIQIENAGKKGPWGPMVSALIP